MVKKIVITGTGRAGTSFLVQLLTYLGLDTGYTQDQLDLHAISNAGLEQPNWEKESSPYIVKSPLIAESIHYTLATGAVEIDHILIPMRPLRHVSASRKRVSKLGGEGTPGGLDSGLSYQEQLNNHARQFFGLMMAIARYEIPHTLIEFPRLVLDCKYTYRQLLPVLEGVTYDQFSDSFARLAKPEFIHFGSGAKPVADGD